MRLPLQIVFVILASHVLQNAITPLLLIFLDVKLLEHKETWVLVYDENNTCISKLVNDVIFLLSLYWKYCLLASN